MTLRFYYNRENRLKKSNFKWIVHCEETDFEHFFNEVTFINIQGFTETVKQRPQIRAEHVITFTNAELIIKENHLAEIKGKNPA